jgi:hypothetical protein
VKLIFNIVIILSCSSLPLFADEADNLAQLEILYQSLLDSLLSDHQVADTSAVIRSLGTAQSINWLIDKEINQALRKQGVKNIFDSTAVQLSQNAIIEYQSLGSSIFYKSLDKLNARRDVTIQLYLKYIAFNGGVLFADTFKSTQSDTVKRKKIEQLENVHLPFTQGKNQASLVSRLAEPLAASLLTGMIILLFYFYRSH